MLSFTHKTVDGTLIKTSNLEIQQTVPSHLVILSDYLSRGMMGSAVWGWFGPWRWGWRAGLILLYLLQYHNTHTASPLRPHREQTFTRHTITHSLTHTLCHSRTWIQSVPSHICAQFSGTKVSSKSRTHSVFLVNKRCTSSQKKPTLKSSSVLYLSVLLCGMSFYPPPPPLSSPHSHSVSGSSGDGREFLCVMVAVRGMRQNELRTGSYISSLLCCSQEHIRNWCKHTRVRTHTD